MIDSRNKKEVQFIAGLFCLCTLDKFLYFRMKSLFILSLFSVLASCQVQKSESNDSTTKPYEAPIITYQEYDCELSTKERLYFKKEALKTAVLDLKGSDCGAYGYSINDTICCNINPLEFEGKPNSQAKINLGQLSPGMHLLVIWNGRNEKVFNIPVSIGF